MNNDPTAMTLRARIYLVAVDALRALILGGLLIFAPLLFKTQTYDTARALSASNLWLWGLVFWFVGGYAIYSAITGSSWHARIGLILSAVITAVWASCYILNAIILGFPLGPWVTLSTIALVISDLLMCAQPMRTPFEVDSHPQAAVTDGR